MSSVASVEIKNIYPGATRPGAESSGSSAELRVQCRPRNLVSFAATKALLVNEYSENLQPAIQQPLSSRCLAILQESLSQNSTGLIPKKEILEQYLESERQNGDSRETIQEFVENETADQDSVVSSQTQETSVLAELSFEMED